MIQVSYVINPHHHIILEKEEWNHESWLQFFVSETIECINRLNSFPGMTKELCKTMKKTSRINYPYNCPYNCLICNNTDQKTRTKRFISQIMNSLDKWHTWLTSVKGTSRMLLVSQCRAGVGKSTPGNSGIGSCYLWHLLFRFMLRCADEDLLEFTHQTLILSRKSLWVSDVSSPSPGLGYLFIN